MNLLNKRPLASVILAMLCALYVYGYTESIVAKVVMIVASVLFCLFIFVFSFIEHKRLTLHKIIAVSLLATLLYAYVRIDYIDPFEDFYGEEVVVSGYVTEKEAVSDYTVALTVETIKINGISEEVKLLTYAKRTSVSHIGVGSIIKYSCYFEKFSSEGDFDERRYYLSEGYDAKTRDNGEIRLVERGEPTFFEELISGLREVISKQIERGTDEDTGGLLSALLLGKRTALPDQLSLDFTRLGCSHILALSGMHLAILCGFLEWILSLFRINKVIRKGLLIPFILTYMLITGLPVSVARAGLMLIISCLLFILVGARDMLTNLLISVAIICFIFPESIFSTSLLLSAFATLGIITLSELYKRSREKRIIVRLSNALLEIILASVLAICATMMISAVSFDGISLFSLFTSPIVSFICELYMCIGGFIVIFGNLLPFNFLLNPLYSLLSSITSFLSDIDISYLSIDHFDTKAFMVLSSVSLFIFMLLKIKRKRAALITVITLFLSTYLSAVCHYAISTTTDTAIYTAEDSSDVIVFNEDGKITVVDTADYTEYSAYAVYDAVKSLGLLHIDNYVLTHYSAEVLESLTKLLGLIEVDTVYLKDPCCDTDEYFYISLTEKLSSARTSIALWGKALYIGDLSVSSLYNYDIEKEEARIALSLRCEEYDLVYLSSGMLEIDTINEATEYTSGADALILGRFGAAYSNICYYGSKYATQDNVYIEGALVALSQKAYERYIAKNKGVHAHEGGYVLYVK